MKHQTKLVILRPLLLAFLLLASYALSAVQPQAYYKDERAEEVSAYFSSTALEDSILSVWKEQVNNHTYTVVVDPGHGGIDSGSMGNGCIEKEITLAIALRLGAYLQAQGVHVVYTRQDDSALAENEADDLYERTRISNANDADAFVSIHLNSSDEEAAGFEVWTSFSDAASYALAQRVHAALNSLRYTSDREVRDQDEYPLYTLQYNEAPSVLLELGFITDADDMRALADDAFQQQLAQAIGEAIIQYLEG